MSKVLILGSGGREHALSWKISQSPLCDKLFIAPGNGGTERFGKNLPLDIMDFKQIHKAVKKYKIEYIIVGPEAPLVSGIYDFFKDKEVKVIGPSKQAAQLEGSKAFAKKFMASFNVPTASYLEVTANNLEEGLLHIKNSHTPIVLKADGLAAGKGVIIEKSKKKAAVQLEEMLNGKFGSASEKVIIEEFLDGLEFSVFVYTDGKEYVLLPMAKDYKRIGEGDKGLNTGGMGAISPVPFVDKKLMNKVIEDIIEPTMEGLRISEMEYTGFIFFGLIKVQGEPYVIEYNCRLGDPETEVILPRLKNDLMELIIASDKHTLNKCKIKFSKKSAATVMLVSGGYPEAYEKGKEIKLSPKIEKSILFHAGTKLNKDKLLTNGGRVLAVTSLDKNFKKAVKRSLKNIKKISFDKMNYRKDIGFDLK